MSQEGKAQAAEERVCEYAGSYQGGVIRLDAPVDWSDGTRVVVSVAEPEAAAQRRGSRRPRAPSTSSSGASPGPRRTP